MNMDFDVLIIGAGVVGLATAEIFARNKMKVLVVEKEARIGTGVSSRNSEVIHAGIYYPKNSLKSLLCLKGKDLLYEYCTKNHVGFKKTGKYIIAVSKGELKLLEKIKQNAAEAGLNELFLTTQQEILKLEPDISCYGGLYSSTSGIISAHELMDSLKQKIEVNDGDFLFLSRVKQVAKNSQSTGYIVEVFDSSGEVTEIEVGAIINCAGLYSDEVAQTLGVVDESYKIKFSKGNYFKLAKPKYRFNHLIYPVPLPKLHGLGVHVTIDLNAQIKFGPDVDDLSANIEDYSIDENRKESFFNAIRKYLPEISLDDLAPDMTGIRPRLAADKEFNDFIINEESGKGFPGIVNCVGIESPGLTASLAIAEAVQGKITG